MTDGVATETVTPESDYQRASRVTPHWNIVAIRFRTIHGKGFATTESLPDEADFRPTIGFTRPSLKYDARGRLIVRTTFIFSIDSDLKSTDGDDISSHPIVQLRAATELVYRRRPKAPDVFADEDLNAFARVNAPFQAWGYWREFTNSTLQRLELPPFALPLFRPGDAKRLLLDGDLADTD